MSLCLPRKKPNNLESAPLLFADRSDKRSCPSQTEVFTLWHTLAPEVIAQELRSDQALGLSETEARTRLATYGPECSPRTTTALGVFIFPGTVRQPDCLGFTRCRYHLRLASRVDRCGGDACHHYAECTPRVHPRVSRRTIAHCFEKIFCDYRESDPRWNPTIPSCP